MMAASFFFTSILLTTFMTTCILCSEIKKTDIKIVTDENRYITRNPDETYTPFDKTHNAKGNIFFKLGERITGDVVICNYMDSTTYTRPTDVEVFMWYPAEGFVGSKISCIEFVTDVTTRDAAAYLVGDGGILKNHFEALLCANQTNRMGYQVIVYGY